MAEEFPKEQEVVILDRDIITSYARFREPHRVVVTTYVAPDMPARTIRIDLTERFPGKEREYEAEIRARKGPRWEEISRLEDELILEDIKAYKVFRPEVKRLPGL